MTARCAVAIPAFDAGASVAEVVERCRPFAAEVLVVDDGSTDDTADAARKAGARVLRHDRNLGKGRALQTAFNELFKSHAQVVTVDADGQHVPEEIPLLVEAARGGADLVIGTREHHFARMNRLRRTSNRLSSKAIATLAGRKLSDVQSGFRLYGRGLYEFVGLPEPGFEAESAVVVRAARQGLSIATVPIRLEVIDGTGTSHYRPIVDSLRIAVAVVRARLEKHP